MNHPARHCFPTLLAWALSALAAAAQDTSLVRTNTNDTNTITKTLTNGPNIALGMPRTIRWSIAKDGAVLPNYYYAGSDPNRPSLLIADLDNDFSVPAGSRGADLTTRPWHPYFASMLDRIAKKTGLSFIYEPNDDGASIGTDGAIGVRGDLRFSGGPLTGALGYNGIPVNSSQPDMVLDTNRVWNGTDLRFIANHEYHHGLGFGHVQVAANGNASAVAPSGGNSNGPQFHDLIQLHRKYGDPYEKPAGNGARASATTLGSLNHGVTLVAGANWDDIWIGADETGFATISSTSDIDFFRVDTSGPMQVRAVLTPKGPVYSYVSEGQTEATVDASKFMNLRLEVQDSAGTVIATAAAQTAGIAETLATLQLPSAGTWYFRVSMEGSSTSPQAYRLEISDSDSDGDGLSDSGEFAVGRNPADPADLAFSFNTEGDQEGWTGGSAVSPRTVSGGSFNGTISGSDPQISRTGFGFAGSGVPNLLIRARASTTGAFQVFWGRTGADAFDGTRVQTVNITQANTWTLLNFNMAAHAQWAGQTITRLRIDPPGGSGATFSIDFIAGQNGASDMVWQSGSGNWDAATANWRLDTNPLIWLTGSRAIFPASAGTVTLTNNTNAAGLEFEASGYTLDGPATLTLAAGADIAAPSGTTTINCPLTASSLTKSGTGTLLLAGPVPPLTSLAAQGGTITFQPPADSVINAPITGTGAIAKSGTTILTLAGANTFSGNIAINSGALRLTRSDSLGSGTKSITMTNGTAGKCRIILAGGTTPVVLPAGISFNSSNNNDALPAVLNESGDNTIQGNFTLTSGGGGTRLFSQAGNLTLSGIFRPNTTGRVLHLDGPGTGTISGVIEDQNATNFLALEKVGSGTWTLSGANTFTGSTTIGNGTLALAGGNDRLPVTTIVTLGSAANSGLLKLDSRSQTLAGLLTAGTGNANRVINGNATAATLTINNTQQQSFAGILGGTDIYDNNFSLTKTGTGTLTLTGPNTFEGNALVQAGTLNLATGGTIVTGAAGTSLTIADGTANATTIVNGGTLSRVKLNIGGATATGTGVLTILSGSVSTSGEIWVGSNPTAAGFGALNIHGGTVTSGSWIGLGRGNSASTTTSTRGLLTMTGGTLNVNGGNLSIGAYQLNPAATSVMRISGGSTTIANSIYVGEYLSGILDISGGTLTTGPDAGDGVRLKTTGAGTGIINLRGGTLTTRSVAAGTGGTSIFNFNGGVLRPSVSATTTFQGLSATYVYPGGAVIDTNGFDITITQPLLAPAGNGVASIATSGGAGYLTAPIVDLTGGGGSGATASADIDTSGNLTGITVTNPGTGYTSAPTVTLVGGGGSGAVIGAVSLAPNTSGCLTKTGVGTLTLTGASTFAGNSAVQAGTLLVNGSFASSVTVAAGGTLGGTGTVAGLAIANSGTGTATISPGSGGIGKLSASGTATLGTGARYLWELRDWTGTAGTGADLLECANLALTATPSAPLGIAITPNQLVNFQNTARSFVIARGTSSMTGCDPSAIRIDSSALTAAAGTWTARQTGTSLELAYTPDGYDSWITATGLTGAAAAPDADPDADGMDNLIEFVLGGEPNPARPNASSTALAPTLVSSSTHLVFTYRRTDLSASQPGIAIGAEYGSDLITWTPAIQGTNGVSIHITDDGFGVGIDRVDVSIPLTQAVGGKLLVRLKATVP